MSLDKGIEHGKERRKPYRGAKAVDKTCRNHGGCPWCEKGRKAKARRRMPVVDEGDLRGVVLRARREKIGGEG
jgi:hypothetical protein